MSWLLLVLSCTPELPADTDTLPTTGTGLIDSADTAETGHDTDCLLFLDQDGDGWGDDSVTTTHCDTEGFVAQGGDCDDQNASIHPEGTEVCNSTDDDCDLAVDEGDVEEATWFQDLDADGYGTETATWLSCDQPEGFAATADDCQDDDATVHPYADETCDDVDQDCDDVVDEDALDPETWHADLDGDGFGDAGSAATSCDAPADHVADATDCDDTQASVYPGADETCDDADQDCDGAVDEDPVDPGTWHADLDGDGYGDPASSVSSCDVPSDHVADSTDCDDESATTSPAGSETCDSVDQDCDGGVDEGVLTAFYADSDGDGYGDADASTQACSAPSGTVVDSTDCDDGNSDAFPGATEHCDGEDGDCDGTVDNDADDETTWFLDSDGDGWGTSGTTLDACDLPSGYAGSDDDCDDGDSSVSPDGVEVCDGVNQDCDSQTDEGVTHTYYWDDDGDGYGGSDKTTEDCSAPSGYVNTSTDCYDQGADAYPGQTDWFDADRGDGSFDFDCDGSETGEDESVSSCSLSTSSFRRRRVRGQRRLVHRRPCLRRGVVVGQRLRHERLLDHLLRGHLVLDRAGLSLGRRIAPMTTLLFPLWLACTPAVGPVSDSGSCTWYVDDDGDGYGAGDGVTGDCDSGLSGALSGLVPEGGDCNDTDPTVNPGATEYCNGEDDDCDKSIDEGDAENAAWYADVDGDGYGSPLSDPLYSCEQPLGTSKFDTDCDDFDAEVYPGADETCNGHDDDCDDLVDDADDPVVGAGVFYRDGDGDGYGRPDVIAEACQPPSDYVSTSGDCNDANSTINPGASEICDDLDQDCDDLVDEDATDIVTWGQDSDNDGYGDVLTETEDCDPPGDDWVADVSDCDDDRSDVYPGATEHCDEADEDCDGTVDEEPVDGSTFYLDSDTDGYGDPDASLAACEQPATYVANASDCYDGNKKANPDQTEFQTGDRGDGSFDFNCDGVEEQEFTELAVCELDDSECDLAEQGWDGGVPACGDRETWVTTCAGSIGPDGGTSCASTGARETQACL